MAELKPNRIVISRTDSIGDVILTLPLAGILKEKYPDAEIIFLGNTYTKPVIECSEHVDEVWEWAAISRWDYNDQLEWLVEQNVDTFIHVFPRKEIARLAKKANIPIRIGTAHRAFHLISCSHLLNFTRKRSELHESQLNTKLLSPFGIKKNHSLQELTGYLGFTKLPELPQRFKELIDPEKKNVILHPKSQGSAIEWGVDKFMALAANLESNNHKVFITGTEKEASFFRNILPNSNNIVDLSGKMTLHELIAFIAACDCLVAASTGPLHIAGITGIKTIGLFLEKKPIHSGRWQPLGSQVITVKSEKISDDTQPLKIDVRLVEKAIQSMDE